jgi:hypothetical protein
MPKTIKLYKWSMFNVGKVPCIITKVMGRDFLRTRSKMGILCNYLVYTQIKSLGKEELIKK